MSQHVYCVYERVYVFDSSDLKNTNKNRTLKLFSDLEGSTDDSVFDNDTIMMITRGRRR